MTRSPAEMRLSRRRGLAGHRQRRCIEVMDGNCACTNVPPWAVIAMTIIVNTQFLRCSASFVRGLSEFASERGGFNVLESITKNGNSLA